MKRLLSFVALAALTLAPAAAGAFTATGFSNPFGIAIDPATNYIYVSNINGDPNGRDDNGFISRLKGDGAIDQLKLIDGASQKFTLHAPKGMTVLGTTLYVADIDKLHAFDLTTGNFLFDVNFGTLPVQHFYDVKPGPDGALFAADGPGNTIYRVDVPRQHEVTAFMAGDQLGQPHGVVWFPARQSFVVAGWSSGQVTAYDRAGRRQPYPAILLRTLEGIAADDGGSLYVTSTGLSAAYRIAANFGLFTFKLGVQTPAGIAFHRAGNQVLIVSTDGNTLQSVELKPPETKKEEAGTELVPMPSPLGPTAAPVEGAKPVEAKPAEAKPVEEKPAEAAKPAETKPAAPPTGEAKPAEAKPAEAKPADAKPAEAPPMATKPAAAKPAEPSAAAKPEATKPAEKPVPEKPAPAQPSGP